MDWWDRLIGRWTLAEVPWVHHYEWDPDVVLQVTEADRLGDLNPANAVVPVVVNPLRWVRHWARGTNREREFVRRATAGTDTLTVSRHDHAALHEVGADVIERDRLVARALRATAARQVA